MDWRVSLAGIYYECNGLGVSVEEKGWGGVLEECVASRQGSVNCTEF